MSFLEFIDRYFIYISAMIAGVFSWYICPSTQSAIGLFVLMMIFGMMLIFSVKLEPYDSCWTIIVGFVLFLGAIPITLLCLTLIPVLMCLYVMYGICRVFFP